jgi:hypothetical protein
MMDDTDTGYSLTFWEINGSVFGWLKHYIENGVVVDRRTTGGGYIPAEYVAYEEAARI